MTPRLLLSPLLSAAAAGPWTTDEDRALAAACGAPRRRCELLTWRAVARRALGGGVRFRYEASGAPAVVGAEAHLSVSHTTDRVAVLLAGRPCAVDIERADRDLRDAFRRLLTPAERILSADPLYPLVACCAKEVLYKYARGRLRTVSQGRLEAVRHVGEGAFPSAEATVEGTADQPSAAGTIVGISARIGDGEPLSLAVRRIGDHVAVWLA